MRKEYDLSKMEGQKNPYIKEFKTQVAIRLDKKTVQYFKMLAQSTGMSYQNLTTFICGSVSQRGKPPGSNGPTKPS